MGRKTREGNRTLEVSCLALKMNAAMEKYHQYAFEDFAIRNVALVSREFCVKWRAHANGHTAYEHDIGVQDVHRPCFGTTSCYPPKFHGADLRHTTTATSGIAVSKATDSRVSLTMLLTDATGFMQKRFANGTSTFTDPVACSLVDNVSRSCSLQDDNFVGFYESSSWEYIQLVRVYFTPILTDYEGLIALYARFLPHDTAHLIELMGGNVCTASLLWYPDGHCSMPQTCRSEVRAHVSVCRCSAILTAI